MDSDQGSLRRAPTLAVRFCARSLGRRPRALDRRGRLRRRLAAFAAFLAAAAVASPAGAAVPGDLDSGFGSAGMVTTGVARHGDDRAEAVAVQSNGKIVAAGRSGTAFAVVRYNADGTLDTSFGGGDGVVTTGFGAGTEARANALAIDADSGAIVVAGRAGPPFDLGGESPGDFALARYTADGVLDPSFGGDGTVTTDFEAGSHDEASDVAIQSDGRIVAAGSSSPPHGPNGFAVARYEPDGDLDPSFSADGKQTTAFGADTFDDARGVAIQADGGIVVAGGTSSETADGFAVARYRGDNGELDTTFSDDGKLTSNVGQSARDVAIQSGGEIVVAGHSTTYDENDVPDDDIALARYQSDGDPDTTFGGGDGEVTTDLGKNEWANALAIQPGGEIVVAATSGASSFEQWGFGEGFGGDLAVARYEPDGSLDDGTLDDPETGDQFGTDGKVITDFGAADEAGGVAIQPSDGAIVVAGSSRLSTPQPDAVQGRGPSADFILARYQPGGALDPTFDGDGKLDTVVGNMFGDRANAVAVQDDGKIVVAGSTVNEQGDDDEDVVVARYEPNGSLDATFGSDGVVTIDLTGQDLRDSASAVAVQDDGAIMVAGASDGDFAVARFKPDGDLDPTFNGDGKVTTDFGGGGFDEARDLAIQADGAIVVSGGAGQEAGGLALARFTSGGTLDSTFGVEGKVTDGSFESFAAGRGIAIEPEDGTIVVAGGTESGGPNDGFGLARFKPGGTLDGTFDGDGKLTTDFVADRNDAASDVVIQSDGAIVAVGTAGAPDTPVAECGGAGFPEIDLALARYKPEDGALDSTFSGDGKLTSDFGGTFDNGFGVAVQPDGPIVAVGRATSDFALARYDPGGALDATFSGDGKVTTDLGASGCDVARDVALTDGEILLAGSTGGAEGSRFALASYLRAADDNVTAEAAAGDTVATGGSPSESNPVTTAVTTPFAGTVEITEEPAATTPAPSGYTLIDFQVTITAPAATRDDPLRIVFELAGSRLPAGGVGAVEVFRNGAVVPNCTGGQLPAGEEACVLSREEVSGNGKVTALAEKASVWNLGVRQAPSGGGTPPGGGQQPGGTPPGGGPQPTPAAPCSGLAGRALTKCRANERLKADLARCGKLRGKKRKACVTKARALAKCQSLKGRRKKACVKRAKALAKCQTLKPAKRRACLKRARRIK